MLQGVATIVFALGILGLFLLDRDRNSRVSPALWIPVVWLSISASRMVSQWLGGVGTLASPDALAEGSPLDALIFAGLLAAGLVVLLARGERAGTFLRANGPLLVFFFYCAVSLLWSDYPFVAFKRWTKAMGDLVMVLVVLTDPEPTAALKRFIARSGFLVVPLSILLIGYYPGVGQQYNPWTGETYNIGVATTKNGLGIVCLVFGLGSLWRVLETLHSGERPRMTGPLIAHGAVLAMVLWLFGKANAATSLGCFLTGGVLIALTSRRGFALRPAAMHLLVVGIVSLCLVGLLLDPDAGLVQAMGRDPTLTGRTELWGDLLRMNADPWLGTGFESFWLGERVKSLWSKFVWYPNQAHNGYLEVFLNLGWVGVALLSFVMAWGYRNVVGSLHRSPELGRLWLAYFVIAVLYNQTDAAFKMMHPVWIAFLLAITVVPSLASPARRRGHDYGKSALSTGSVSDDGRVRSPRSLLSALIVSSEEEEREYQRRYS
jgi:O-antigen ligase